MPLWNFLIVLLSLGWNSRVVEARLPVRVTETTVTLFHIFSIAVYPTVSMKVTVAGPAKTTSVPCILIIMTKVRSSIQKP